MTIVSKLWSPQQLKRINDDPALVSLLYDLNLLPEVIAAHIRQAVREEREHCLTLIECSIPSLRALAPTLKDPKVATIHANALEEAGKAVRESGRFRDALEARKSQEGQAT